MKIKKHSYPPIHVGTPLMLVIFIILCLVIFSVLSLSGAAKDSGYSQKNAQRTTAYYEACNQAETALMEIDQVLSFDSTEGLTADLEALGYVSVSVEDTGLSQKLLAEYHVSIDEDEILQVVLSLHPTEEIRYHILSWKQVSTASWSGDQTLPVLGAGEQTDTVE